MGYENGLSYMPKKEYKKISKMSEKQLIKAYGDKEEDYISPRHDLPIKLPYDMDKGKDQIVNSWSYEYGIFELVRIYKTFDFKNNILIWTGG